MTKSCFLCSKKLGFWADTFGKHALSQVKLPIPKGFGDEDIICLDCFQSQQKLEKPKWEESKPKRGESKPNKSTDSEKLRLENLEIIEKLEKSEIGNPEKLEKIKKVLEEFKALSEDDLGYLREKYGQLTLVDDEEGKINRALQSVKRLEAAEIGNPKRLESIRNVLRSGELLSIDDDNYIQDKLDQLEKIEPTLQKNFSEKTQDVPQHSKLPQRQQLELKSEGTALVLAILLGLFGLCGIGQIYCSRVGRGIGILIFGLVLTGFIWGFTMAYYGEVLSNIFEDTDNVEDNTGLVLYLLGFGVFYLAFFIWQIFDAKDLAREWNEYVETHDGSRPW